MSTVEHSIVEAVKSIDQLLIRYRIVVAERDQLRRRLAEAETQRDTWRTKAGA